MDTEPATSGKPRGFIEEIKPANPQFEIRIIADKDQINRTSKWLEDHTGPQMPDLLKELLGIIRTWRALRGRDA